MSKTMASQAEPIFSENLLSNRSYWQFEASADGTYTITFIGDKAEGSYSVLTDD